MSSPGPSMRDNVEVLHVDYIKEEDGSSPIGIEQDEEFNYLHGDIRLRVKNTQFVIHSYHLQSFNHIVKKLPPRETSISTIVKLLKGEVDDFRNTLRVLYSGRNTFQHEQFDALTWRSALWVATEYDDPELRAFCIRQLDAQDLTHDDRLCLAKEFNIPEWKDHVVHTSVHRIDTLTAAEIRSLEAELVADIMAQRERRLNEQRVTRPAKRVRTRKAVPNGPLPQHGT